MRNVIKPMTTAATLAGLALAVPAAAAQMTSGSAGTPRFYLGAGAGVANFEDRVEFRDLGDVDLDDDDTAYKLFGGYRVTPNFGIEGGYRNFGEASAGPFSVESDGLDVSGVAFLPLGPVDLFAKGGVIFWNSDGGGGFPDDDGTDLTYGVGGQLNLGRLFVRVESEWFEMDVPEETQMFTGSVGLSF